MENKFKKKVFTVDEWKIIQKHIYGTQTPHVTAIKNLQIKELEDASEEINKKYPHCKRTPMTILNHLYTSEKAQDYFNTNIPYVYVYSKLKSKDEESKYELFCKLKNIPLRAYELLTGNELNSMRLSDDSRYAFLKSESEPVEKQKKSEESSEKTFEELAHNAINSLKEKTEKTEKTEKIDSKEKLESDKTESDKQNNNMFVDLIINGFLSFNKHKVEAQSVKFQLKGIEFQCEGVTIYI